MLAYVIARPDIGYVITRLSKLFTQSCDVPYLSLKVLCKYLRRTIDWGITHWRPFHVSSLSSDPRRPIVNPHL